MIKKLTALFAVLTAVCVIAIIPLIPFAVQDVANYVIPQYNQMKAVLPVEAFPLDDNITTLCLDGSMVDLGNIIRITHSDSREIIVKSDRLSPNALTVEASIQGDIIRIAPIHEYDPYNLLLMDSPSEIWDKLIQLCIGRLNIEIAVPDGLILIDENGEDLLDPKTGISDEYRYPIFKADWDVQYAQKENIWDNMEPDDIEPPQPEYNEPPRLEETEPAEPTYEERVKNLRRDLLELVQTNARGGYSQVEFNMNLNDCRIRMENLLMEYAERENLINYDKYKDQTQQSSASSRPTGLGAKRTPVDESVDESEAKAVIRELCDIYLGRLVAQAKMDLYRSEGSSADDREALQQQIEEDTRKIKELEENHTEFVAGLMATGLLF